VNEEIEIIIHDTSEIFSQGELYYQGRQFWFRYKYGGFEITEYEGEVLDSEMLGQYDKEHDLGPFTEDEVEKVFRELVLSNENEGDN